MKRLSWLIVCVFAMFASTGCWLSASSDTIPTPVALILPSPTPEPPTETPTELPTIETPTLEPEIVETEEVFPSETPTLETPVLLPDGSTQVAQLSDEEFFASSTALIEQATASAVALTLTAEQIFNPPLETATPEFVFPTETPTPEQPVLSGGDCIHVVRIGDNLFRLSMYYGVPIKDIAADNGITNYDLIIVNQELRIRGCGTTGNRPPNEGSISGGGDVSTSGGSDFTPTGGVVHIVEQGETLYQISLRYGVPIREIQARNNIVNVNLIYFNQELIIP